MDTYIGLQTGTVFGIEKTDAQLIITVSKSDGSWWKEGEKIVFDRSALTKSADAPSQDYSTVDSNSTAHSAYEQFLENKEYAEYETTITKGSHSEEMSFKKYAYYDLDADGVDELILSQYSVEEREMGDGYSVFFHYNVQDESVDIIDVIDSTGAGGVINNRYVGVYYGPDYSLDENCLMYFSGEGHSVYFYQYNGSSVVFVKEEYITSENNARVYRRIDCASGADNYISEEEYLQSGGERIEFEWQDLP